MSNAPTSYIHAHMIEGKPVELVLLSERTARACISCVAYRKDFPQPVDKDLCGSLPHCGSKSWMLATPANLARAVLERMNGEDDK